MAVGVRKAGEFCWINILSGRPKEAQSFFAKVLGWTFTEMTGGMGWNLKVNGLQIGGLFDLQHPNTPFGLSPDIGLMIKVDKLEAVAAQVVALGGTAREPMVIGPAGRMAVCKDPLGAAFDLWEPNNLQGFTVDSSQPGAPSWFEVLTVDPPRATAFYTQLFGWSAATTPLPHMTYTQFSRDGVGLAGMGDLPAPMSKRGPHWGVYFTVLDADATAALAVQAGGTLCLEPREVPRTGRMCGIVSPQGVRFYVMAYLPELL